MPPIGVAVSVALEWLRSAENVKTVKHFSEIFLKRGLGLFHWHPRA
jgi:hypothetical protein